MPLETSTGAGSIRLSVGPNGEARLLLPLTAQEIPAGIDAGGALAITLSSFVHRGRAQRFLDLTCLSDELEQVFAEVVDEIVARVSGGVGSVEATRTTLDDFRALLAGRPSYEIERSRVAGLVAEMVILNRLLDVSPSAWRTWRGPAGDRHDFRAAENSLEVKASLRAGSVAITINGLQQLEPPSGGALHLAHFILEPVSGGLLTVAGLGGRALAQADDPAGLRDLLAGIGCPDVQNEAWNRHAFRVEKESLYSVEGDFPRIVPSSFIGFEAPAGVADVTYRIDLSIASSFLCPPDKLQQLVRTFAQ